MRSRALNLAALALLAGLCGSTGVAVQPVVAQQLDAGKPPAQIFAGTCAACHRSPRGLVRSVAPGSLPGFLRQHYTTGNDMAGTMASFVLGNGGTQQVAEPPARQEPKQRAKSDGQDVAARTPAVEPKAQSKTAKQPKAGKKGQPEPAAAAPAQEPEGAKPEAAKPETPAAPAEPSKAEAAATECKVETAKPVDESTPPKQPAALLTLPGFPAPIPEPEPEPTAQGGCEPSASPTVTAAARADDQQGGQAKDQVKDQAKEQVKEQAKDQPQEQPKEQAPATPPPALAEAPKAEPLRATVTEIPALDIMREEVHTPRLVRPSQKKRAPTPQ